MDAEVGKRDSLRDVMTARAKDFTRTERHLHSVLMADYPFSALKPIQELSDLSNVSAPTISRFVGKLGYGGFQGFQQAALEDLRGAKSSPIELRHDRPGRDDDPVQSYFGSTIALIEELGRRFPRDQFDRCVEMLGDPKNRVFVIGGRMSDTLAGFFLRHLRQIRADAHHVPRDTEAWPDDLLRMRSRDVVVILDFRRYDPALADFAAKVRGRKARTIVMTDTWISPAARGAHELICVPTESGTLWDSYAAAFVLLEALLVPLAERDWDRTKSRIEEWDDLRREAET